jgi:NadR type nicotinamide-nucleotide adenylyltransferase
MATVKIALIGPESTGKSTLARDLAEHFHALCVAEYARHYLEQKGEHSYDLADLETIARQQVAQIQRALSANPKVLFCDTDLVTLHIWSLDKFDQTIPFVEEQLQQQKADLYLLCKPDIPWQPDPLREDATRREELYSWNMWVLRQIDAQIVEVEGLADQRFQLAVNAVETFLSTVDS